MWQLAYCDVDFWRKKTKEVFNFAWDLKSCQVASLTASALMCEYSIIASPHQTTWFCHHSTDIPISKLMIINSSLKCSSFQWGLLLDRSYYLHFKLSQNKTLPFNLEVFALARLIDWLTDILTASGRVRINLS